MKTTSTSGRKPRELSEHKKKELAKEQRVKVLASSTSLLEAIDQVLQEERQ